MSTEKTIVYPCVKRRFGLTPLNKNDYNGPPVKVSCNGGELTAPPEFVQHCGVVHGQINSGATGTVCMDIPLTVLEILVKAVEGGFKVITEICPKMNYENFKAGGNKYTQEQMTLTTVIEFDKYVPPNNAKFMRNFRELAKKYLIDYAYHAAKAWFYPRLNVLLPKNSKYEPNENGWIKYQADFRVASLFWKGYVRKPSYGKWEAHRRNPNDKEGLEWFLSPDLLAARSDYETKRNLKIDPELDDEECVIQEVEPENADETLYAPAYTSPLEPVNHPQ